MIYGNSWRRYVILAPPLLLTLGGLALTLAALSVWGDTSGELHPAWLPSLVAFHLAGPLLAIGGFSLYLVWRDTRYAFQISFPQCLSGILLPALGIWGLLLAEEVASAGVYQGTVFRVDPEDSTTWVVSATLPTLLLLTILVVIPSYTYSRSINARDPSKWDKRPEEPDAMGAIIRSARGR